MENTINFNQLKTNLQQLGAIRPEAWEMILQLHHYDHIHMHNSYIRKAGGLTYIGEGLLKEYTTADRKSPTIINFLGKQQWIITRLHNEHDYLKACLPTQLLYWTFEDLAQLYQKFPELLDIFHTLCAGYDANIYHRQWMLEPIASQIRILRFKERFHEDLKFLKKKDIANYLQINYSHFVQVYNESL